MGDDAGGQHDARQGADDHGIPERTAGRDERLPHRIAVLCGGGGNGGGPQPGFIGKEAAGHAGSHGRHHGGAHHAPGGGLPREGAVQNVPDGRKNVVRLHGQDVHAAQNVNDRHDRHEKGAYPGNAPDASQHHQGRQDGQHGGRSPEGNGKSVVKLFGGGVSLRQVADAEGGNGREHGEGDAQPFAFHAAFQHKHGTAAHVAVRVFHPVLDGEQSFGIACSHAKNARQPAPENGPRPPGGNRHSHADDIARANVGGQGHHQGTERGNIPLVRMVLYKIEFQGLEQVALRKAQNDG